MENAHRVLAWLHELQQAASIENEPRIVPLESLKGYRLDSDGFSGRDAEFQVRHFKIPGREREAWDQPLVASRSPGLLRLFAFLDGGELRFVFRATREPGLVNRVELQPTVVFHPGESPDGESGFSYSGDGEVVAEVWQSEEGGRFFRDKNLHQIVLSKYSPSDIPADHVALSLREMEQWS